MAKDSTATLTDGPVRVVDKGSFSSGRCECGWHGPARRSRKKARADAAAHLSERCKAVKHWK